MVSKSGPDLQRRHRGCAPRDLAPSDFFHVPAEPRQYRNSEPYLEPNGKCTRSCRLNRPKTSLGGLLAGGGLFDHAHDVALFHDQVVDAVDVDLGARPFAEQHPVALLEVDWNKLAAFVAPT